MTSLVSTVLPPVQISALLSAPYFRLLPLCPDLWAQQESSISTQAQLRTLSASISVGMETQLLTSYNTVHLHHSMMPRDS